MDAERVSRDTRDSRARARLGSNNTSQASPEAPISNFGKRDGSRVRTRSTTQALKAGSASPRDDNARSLRYRKTSQAVGSTSAASETARRSSAGSTSFAEVRRNRDSDCIPAAECLEGFQQEAVASAGSGDSSDEDIVEVTAAGTRVADKQRIDIRAAAGTSWLPAIQSGSCEDLPEGVLSSVLSCVSQITGCYWHALVCRRWAQSSAWAQKSMRVGRELWLSEETLIRELGAFPNLTVVVLETRAAYSLSSAFLRAIRQSCPSLVRLQLQEHATAAFSGFFATGLGEFFQGAPPGLQHLHVGCVNTGSCPIPPSISSLRSLRTLRLTSDLVRSLPTTLGSLSALRQLTLEGLSLVHLPGTVSSLSQLRQLRVKSCNLLGMPDNVGALSRLKRLSLECWGFPALPDSVTRLTQLEVLELRMARLLSLPQGLGALSALQELRVHSWRLQLLPVSLSNLHSLRLLHLHCEGLRVLPGELNQLMAGLQDLSIHISDRCVVLAHVPGTTPGQNFPALRHFSLNCPGVVDFSLGANSVPCIETLSLANCTLLRKLPDDMRALAGLRELRLSGARALTYLPKGFTALRRLELLEFVDCGSLRVLPLGIWRLSALQSLILRSCGELLELPPSLGRLPNLAKLQLVNCVRVGEIPGSLGHLRGLTELELKDLWMLRELPESLGQLSSLRTLRLLGMRALKRLPESLGDLGTLQTLQVESCCRLVSLPASLSQLHALQTLELCDLPRIRELPAEIGDVQGLQTLQLRNLSQVQDLPDSLGQLAALRSLTIEGLDTLRRLPDALGNLGRMRVLSVIGCRSLVHIPACVEELPRLCGHSLRLIRGLRPILEQRRGFEDRLRRLRPVGHRKRYHDLPTTEGDEGLSNSLVMPKDRKRAKSIHQRWD